MKKHIKNHITRYILIILIIFVACLIFHFSAQVGVESSQISQGITKYIFGHIDYRIEHIIRKIAHFSIYFVFGMLLMGCAATFKNASSKKQLLISMIISLLYAAIDEIHQYFVPGRSAMVNDVLLDFLGAFIGIILVFLILFLLRRKNKKKLTKPKKKTVMFISSTGGHLNELLQCRPIFDKFEYVIVTEKTPTTDDLSKRFPDHVYYLKYGTRKQRFKYIFLCVGNLIRSLKLYFKIQPDVIVTTGTHTAVPMCYISKMFGSKIIWIETFANETSKTLAGKLVYPIADTFVVQWKSMQKLYKKAVYWGWIY